MVIQADLFDALDSVTVLPVTSTLVDAPLLRIELLPDAENGLRKPSQIMLDKLMTVRKQRLGPVFGAVGANTLVEVERCLALFLGIAK